MRSQLLQASNRTQQQRGPTAASEARDAHVRGVQDRRQPNESGRISPLARMDRLSMTSGVALLCGQAASLQRLRQDEWPRFCSGVWALALACFVCSCGHANAPAVDPADAAAQEVATADTAEVVAPDGLADDGGLVDGVEPADGTTVADTTVQDADADAGTPTACTLDPAPSWAQPAPAAKAPPGAQCATPGWPNAAGLATLAWLDITQQSDLAAIGPIDPCLLWQDLTGDGVADLVVVTLPTTPTADRVMQLWQGQSAGHFSHDAQKDVKVVAQAMDCAAADLDGDALPDIVLATTLGPRVLKNTGSGFTDISPSAVPPEGQSLPTRTLALTDLDADGDLDLIVGQNYNSPNTIGGLFQCAPAEMGHTMCCLSTVPDPPTACFNSAQGTQGVWKCCPTPLPEETVPIFRNDKGAFVDVSKTYAWKAVGNSFTISAFDLDRDGALDVFMGNDFGDQGWFHQDGPGAYTYKSTGMGMRPYGHPMGSTTADWDGDHRTDFLVTDWGASVDYRPTSTGFQDVGDTTGIQVLTKDSLTWAHLAVDFDNDGWIDVVTSTSIRATPGQLDLAAGDPNHNTDKQTAGFHIVSHNMGGKFVQSKLAWPANYKNAFLGMSVAAGDWDGDGDMDVLATSPPGLLSVWRNDTVTANHWLKVALKSASHHPDGALVQVWSGGYLQERRWQMANGYGAHPGELLHFGLGSVAKIDVLRVVWPSGKVTELAKPAADAQITVCEPGVIDPACSGP